MITVIFMFEMGIREVEQTFAGLYRVPPDKMLAFQARLEHLRKKGWPSGLTSGRGKVARFKPEQLLETAVALALIDVGLTPDNVVRLLTSASDELREGFSRLRQVDAGEAWSLAAQSGVWKGSSSIAGCFTVGVLSEEPAFEFFEFSEEFVELHPHRSAIHIDLGAIWAQVISAASKAVGANPSDVAGLSFGGAGYGLGS